MNKPILILMDDVHLEGRDSEEAFYFKEKVNEAIEQVKNENNIPIVICAGDIGEGTNGIKWASEFNAEIIYVCGNHEFWEGDFYDTQQEINNFINLPENNHIYFLNNNEIILHGIRFIGSSLWTNLGSNLPWLKGNCMIKYHGAMRDFKKITAKNWFSPENEKRLAGFLNHNGLDPQKIKEIIDKKMFNPLLELEENKKAEMYIRKALGVPFSGKTVVVTHHLPSIELWMKIKDIPVSMLSSEDLSNERDFYDAATGGETIYKDILMMGYYTNDLKDLCLHKMSPDFWLHGHLHSPVQECLGKTKIISSPVGYKRQSSEMKYKLIDLDHGKKMVAEQVRREIDNYDLNKNILNNLKELEKIIKMIQTDEKKENFNALDYQAMLMCFKSKHTENLTSLKKQINEWLKLFIYNGNYNFEHINDYFYNIKKLKFLEIKLNVERQQKKIEIKYVFPEELIMNVNEFSFEATKNHKEFVNSHYTEWLKQLMNIQMQVNHLKTFLLAYSFNYEQSNT